jgi:hypothetical protein
VDDALSLRRHGHREASPQVRRQINQAFYKLLPDRSGGVTGAVLTDDFTGMLTEDLVVQLTILAHTEPRVFRRSLSWGV